MKRVEMLLFMLGIVFILTFWLASREEKIPFKLWYYTDATYDVIAYSRDTLFPSTPKNYWNDSFQPYDITRAESRNQ